MRLDYAPRHVALAPDGNGRWATLNGMPRAKGHRAGTRVLPPSIEVAAGAGVEALSAYLFSTENWNRPPEQVASMLSILATSQAAVAGGTDRAWVGQHPQRCLWSPSVDCPIIRVAGRHPASRTIERRANGRWA